MDSVNATDDGYMKLYRKRPVLVHACQWFGQKQIGEKPIKSLVDKAKFGSGGGNCSHCDKTAEHHGWVDTLEGGYVVCPGDFIIRGVAGEYYPCKPAIFASTYDEGIEGSQENLSEIVTDPVELLSRSISSQFSRLDETVDCLMTSTAKFRDETIERLDALVKKENK